MKPCFRLKELNLDKTDLEPRVLSATLIDKRGPQIKNEETTYWDCSFLCSCKPFNDYGS